MRRRGGCVDMNCLMGAWRRRRREEEEQKRESFEVEAELTPPLLVWGKGS